MSRFAPVLAALLFAAGLLVRRRQQQVVLCDEAGVARHTLSPGDVLSIHGQSGEVYAGAQEVRGV